MTYPPFAPSLKFRSSVVGLGPLPGTARVLTASIPLTVRRWTGCPWGRALLGEGSVSPGNSCQVSQADENISGHGELRVREATRKDTSQIFADPRRLLGSQTVLEIFESNK